MFCFITEVIQKHSNKGTASPPTAQITNVCSLLFWLAVSEQMETVVPPVVAENLQQGAVVIMLTNSGWQVSDLAL